MRCGVLGRARSGKCYEVRTTRRFGPVVIIKAANDEIEPIVEQSAENLEFICQIAALGIRCGGKQREGNANPRRDGKEQRSEEHTSELQSLMRISYAVFCLKKTNNTYT